MNFILTGEISPVKKTTQIIQKLLDTRRMVQYTRFWSIVMKIEFFFFNSIYLINYAITQQITMFMLNAKKILAKSLESGVNMKFTQFVKFNGINLNESYVDAFFHNLESDIPIYMSETVISYFGYKGTISDQKKAINLIISENFIDYEKQLYFKYSNDEYIKFRNEKIEILSQEISWDNKIDELYPLETGKNSSKRMHLLVTPKLFKEMLMLCNTEKGKQVRRFYIDMVEVMEIYIQYQNKLTINSLEQKLDNISLTLHESNKKLDESNKKLDEERQKADERFNKLLGAAENTNQKLDAVLPQRVLIAYDDPDHPQVYILRDCDATAGELNLYYMRCQTSNYAQQVKKLKSNYGDNIRRMLTIKQPNAIVFWKEIKKELSANIIKSKDSNWFRLQNMTNLEFKQKINELDSKRKRV
jgi:hypothetical protein